MEEQTTQVTQTPQMSGEGTITGPGVSGGGNKTPFYVAGVIFLFMLVGGYFLMPKNNPTSSPTPTPVQQSSQPMSMQTFTKDQAQNPVTAQNVESVLKVNQFESQNGFDDSSINNAVLDAFTK